MNNPVGTPGHSRQFAPLATLLLLLLPHQLVWAQFHVCADPPITRAEQPNGSGGVWIEGSKWNDGQDLHVTFLQQGYSSFVMEKIKFYSKEWEQYANVHFVYDNSSSPDILIELNDDGFSWSMVGTDSRLKIRSGLPSMHYGWFSAQTPEGEFRRTILHEFGHALGLCHEHLNPQGNIQWNKPVVYAYYEEKYVPHWSKDQVDQDIFGKLSGSLSNKTYDPQSIMHYPIPPEFTSNGYFVPWNTDLSEGDKQVVAEMYPRQNVNPASTVTANVDSMTVTYNVYQDGMKGMLIKPYLRILHALGRSCNLNCHVYYNVSGQPVKALSSNYANANGDLTIHALLTPAFDNTIYNELQFFVPYGQLNLYNGEYKLKFNVALTDPNNNEIIRSGDNQFTYTDGIVCKDLQLLSDIDNNNHQLVVRPKFTIINAQGFNCRAIVYFWDQNGPLKRNGSDLGFERSFSPGYPTTYYNLYDNRDSAYSLVIKYDDIPLQHGVNDLRYRIVLYYNDKDFATSGWNDLRLTTN